MKQIIRDVRARRPVTVTLGPDDLNRLLNNLQGLTLMEAEKILTKAMVEDGRLDVEDIQVVVEHKKAIVEREGLLEYYPVEESMQGIADLRVQARHGADGPTEDRDAAYRSVEQAQLFIEAAHACDARLTATPAGGQAGAPAASVRPTGIPQERW